MYQSLLADASFFSLLLRIDRDLAQQARAGGCPWCGGVLHRASYRRKPRGGPVRLGREHAERFSFCCSVEGCRRRVTPASVRFLGRKVFFAAVVLLVPVLRDGPRPERLGRLEELFTVDRRTLGRWRRWWRENQAAGEEALEVEHGRGQGERADGDAGLVVAAGAPGVGLPVAAKGEIAEVGVGVEAPEVGGEEGGEERWWSTGG